MAATAVVARRLPGDTTHADTSLRAETAALKHPRLWLVYLAIALIQAVASPAAYSYVAPLLTDRAHLATAVVPLAMLGFGIGALVGTTVGGRLGDCRPYATLIPATAVTAVLLGAIILWATNSVVAVVLVVLLGGACFANNPVVVGEVVRIAGATPSPARQRLTDRFDMSLPVNQRSSRRPRPWPTWPRTTE